MGMSSVHDVCYSLDARSGAGEDTRRPVHSTSLRIYTFNIRGGQRTYIDNLMIDIQNKASWAIFVPDTAQTSSEWHDEQARLGRYDL